MFPPEKTSRRICPRHQVVVVQPAAVEFDAELVPLDSKHSGFESRLPPVTEADHIAVGIAVNAKKPTAEWKDLELHYALEQQQHRGGGL